jgi:hypothetical protein
LLALVSASCSSPKMPLSEMADDTSAISTTPDRKPSGKQQLSLHGVPSPEATSGLGSPAKADETPVQASGEPVVVTRSIRETKLYFSQDWEPMPRVGTPEWERERLHDEEREREINQRINSICRGC